ncbi:hypothetical protein [Salinigranum sp.]|uniref:hypothetical protein n=1 Tax=Salinigranum sp. TaxID=1966351 RepID=UPI003564D7AA
MSDADPTPEAEDCGGTDGTDARPDADTFGVGIHVTEEELQFVVHVPSAIDSGWTDPEAFQRLVERVVWDHLDQEATLRAIASSADTGETVTLGTVSLRPGGTVVDHSLSAPKAREGTDGADER